MRYVIMIGNGFDIGLGLKTAYSDFIDDYKNSPAIHSEGCDERTRVDGILKECNSMICLTGEAIYNTW